MNRLAPLETLFTVEGGRDIPLPSKLAALYGRLQFPPVDREPYIFANFVSTLDGVVSLNEPGHTNAGEISGFDPHDQMVMGLLRAVSDAVIAGASAVRQPPGHIWTPEYIYPALAPDYLALRKTLGLPESPLNVVVTASGGIDLSLPIFQQEGRPVLVVTTEAGAWRLAANPVPGNVRILAAGAGERLPARAILGAVEQVHPARLILIEGGPGMLGEFLAEDLLDELFLTLAPQIAGRLPTFERPGLVSGQRFAPARPIWSTLVGVKRGGSHLYLRYALRDIGLSGHAPRQAIADAGPGAG